MTIKQYLKKFQLKKLKEDFLIFLWKIILFSFSFFFVLIVLESIFWFPTYIRLFFNYITIIFLLSILIFSLVFIFLFKNEKLKRYSIENIALEVGKNHLNTKDELLNAIQLEKEINQSNSSLKLIKKMINDVIIKIKKIDFKSLKPSSKVIYQKKQSLFFSFIFLVFVFIYFPEFYNANFRLINPSKNYVIPKPFKIHSLNKDIYIMGGDSAKVLFTTNGLKSPDSLLVELTGENYNHLKWLKPTKKNIYEHKIIDIKQNLSYRAYINSNKIWERWNQISSNKYSIEVIDRPKIQNINFQIFPPKYSKLDYKEQEGNIAEIKSLKGSTIKIEIKSNKNLGSSHLFFNNSKKKINLNINKNLATGNIIIKDEGFFNIHILDTRKIKNLNSIKYKIIPIKDEFPDIKILSPNLESELGEDFKIPLQAQISDDFGFSNFQIVYEIINPDNIKLINSVSAEKIFIEKKFLKSQNIAFDWNLNSFELIPGDKIRYHFELYDNDLISGPKKTISNKYITTFPSIADLFRRSSKDENNIEKEINKIITSIRETSTSIRNSELKLIKSKNIDWNEKQKIDQLLSNLNQNIDDLKKIEQSLDKLINQNEKHNLFSKEMINKFSKLKNLINEIMNDDIIDATNKLSENLQNISPNELLNSLNKIQSKSSQIEKDLDRFIKIFKRINIEKKLEELQKRTDNIFNQQNNLTEEIDKKSNNKILLKTQSQIKQEFENIETLMRSTSQLMEPFSKASSKKLNDLNKSDEFYLTKKEIKINENNLTNNNFTESKLSSNQISSNLKSINSKFKNISKNYSEITTNQMILNFEKIFLQTLYLSKGQESLNSSTIKTPISSPRLSDIARDQQILKDQLNQLINTFLELSTETFSITPKIGRLIGKATFNMNESLNKLEQRLGIESSNHQKEVIKSLNETAHEILKSMDNMKNSGSSSGFDEFLKQMESLSNNQAAINSETLSFLMGDMNKSNSKGFIQRLVNNQSQIKKSIEKMLNELFVSNSTENQIDKINNDMKDILNELSNNRINANIIDKQNKILSRMLNTQKALNEQNDEQKRISSSIKAIEYSTPNRLPNDLGQRRNIVMDALKNALKIDYSLDYQNMIKLYFNTLLDSL